MLDKVSDENKRKTVNVVIRKNIGEKSDTPYFGIIRPEEQPSDPYSDFSLVDYTGESVDSIWNSGALAEGNINWKLKNAHLFEQPTLLGVKTGSRLFEISELDKMIQDINN